MNRYFIILIIILTFFRLTILHSQTTASQQKQVSLDNTEQFSIDSKYVSEKYTIQVGLPATYTYSHKSYPVVYVLDGEKSFGIAKGLTDWLVFSNEIKEVIVVGIRYGNGWWEKRSRDYTQYKDTVYYYYPKAGGADNFLGFIKNELFPLIDKNYRTIKDSNTIVGLSFGGLLSSYVLFTQPEMFKGYIIISPSLFWNGNSILKTEADFFSKHKVLSKNVYLAYGSLDDRDWVINPTNELLQVVQTHKYEGFKFTPEIFKGETHISVFPVALTHGLKYVLRH